MQRLRAFAGAFLVVVGLTASIVALPASLLVLGLVVGWMDSDETEPWPPEDLPVDDVWLAWAISTPLAVFGVRSGLRLARRDRTLVLFLRRFGYDDATNAVTFAVTNTLGRSWRLVTLDDAEIAPLGVTTSTRVVFRAGRFLSKSVLGLGSLVAYKVFPTAVTILWAIAAIGVLSADDWTRAVPVYIDILTAVLDRRLPFDAVGPSLPGAFALAAIVAALSFVGLMAVGVSLLLALPLATILFFMSSSAEAVRDAERLKTVEIRTAADIDQAASRIAARSRKVFGPRLVVLRVASSVWQQTVSRMASVASVPLIDVSEPTENVLWEIEALTARFGSRCVVIGHHDRVSRLAAPPPSKPSTGSLEERLARLLAGREVLAYTTDRRGMRRFARALRGALLSRSA